MHFFSFFHRSVVDPSFYYEAVRAPLSRALIYITMLCMLSILAMTTARYVYTLNPQDGLAPKLESLFENIYIKDGRLYPARETPYALSREKLAVVINELLDVRGNSTAIRDSFIILDTSSSMTPQQYPTAPIIMGASRIYINTRGTSAQNSGIPYSNLLSQSNDFHFSKDAILSILHNHGVLLFIFLLLQQCIVAIVIAVLVCVLLFIATYLLSPYRIVRAGNHCKLILFSLTPVCTGNALVAVSGFSRVSSIWIVFALFSLVIVIRGKRYIRRHMQE